MDPRPSVSRPRWSEGWPHHTTVKTAACCRTSVVAHCGDQNINWQLCSHMQVQKCSRIWMVQVTLIVLYSRLPCRNRRLLTDDDNMHKNTENWKWSDGNGNVIAKMNMLIQFPSHSYPVPIPHSHQHFPFLRESSVTRWITVIPITMHTYSNS